MKSLLVFISLASSLAFAEIKPLGTFVPSQCGFSQSGQVCFGTKAGMKGSFVSVAVQRARAIVYQVTKTTPVNAGANPNISASVLNLVSDYKEKARATVRSSNGEVTSITVNLGNGTVVSVGALQIVLVTL